MCDSMDTEGDILYDQPNLLAAGIVSFLGTHDEKLAQTAVPQEGVVVEKSPKIGLQRHNNLKS